MRPTTTLALLLTIPTLAGCASPGAGPGISFSDEATYAANHDFVVTVPDGTEMLRVWFAMPSDREPAQTMRDWTVDVSLTTPYDTRIVRDETGNRFFFLEARNPTAEEFVVSTSFELTRREVRANVDPAATRAHTEAELADLAPHLRGSSQSPIDENARTLAREWTRGETNPVIAARRIYDGVLEFVEYHVKDPKPNSEKTMNSTGTGSSVKTYETRCGNCTDFHSLYAAVARAARIPTRVVYGSFFKGPLDGVDADQSYHCWVEFHAPEIGWVPLDVAVADIFVDGFRANEFSRPRAELTTANGYAGPDPDLVDYYFGNLEDRRVTWHHHRDLVMRDPRQEGPPLLWNPKAYAEADGEAIPVGRTLTFTQIAGAGTATAAHP